METGGENAVAVFFPKAGRLRMALHCFEYWNGESRRNGWALFVINPPVMEGLVWMNVEPLLWWWGFSECIGDVRAEDDEVFGSGGSVEDM